MATVTIKDLSEQLDVIQIADHAYGLWQSKQRRRRTVEQWVIKLLAPALVVMAVIFYALSAPHTAQIMMLVTPGLAGAASPLGWELGVLIVAILRERGWKTRMTTSILWLLLLMSIAINIIGGFISVIMAGTAVNLDKATLPELIGKYGELSAFYQIALFIVIPIGIAIPIIGKFAGEAVVKITTGRIRLEQNTDESRWIAERPSVVYSALFQAAIQLGAGAATAGSWSQAVCKQLYRDIDMGKSEVSTVSTVTARGQSLPTPVPTGFQGRLETVQGQDRLGQSVLENQKPDLPLFGLPSKDQKGSPAPEQSDLSTIRVRKEDVRRWLSERPNLLALPDREIARRYMEAVYGLDSDSPYKTVQRVRKELE